MSVFAINSCHLRPARRSVNSLRRRCFVFSCPKRQFFFFSWRPVFAFSFFIFPRENQLKKKISRIENQRRKGRESITPANSNSLLSRTPPPKPWQARTRRQLNHSFTQAVLPRTSPRLQCVTLIYAQELSLHILDHGCHKDLVNLLRWGILKTIWRVVWYGGTYKSTGKQPLGYYPASAPALLRLAVP